MGSLDNVRLDHEVVVNELGRSGAVREDAADCRSGDDHHIGPILGHPALDIGLTTEVDVFSAYGKCLDILGRKAPYDR
jgi:hypothetical protein